jgi:hypothetical protein
MPIYRFYWLNAENHFTLAENVRFAGDRLALVAAAAVKGNHAAIEVWQRTRFVGRVEPSSQTDPPSRPWLCWQGIRHQTRAMIAAPCLDTLLTITNCPCSSPDCPFAQELGAPKARQ